MKKLLLLPLALLALLTISCSDEPLNMECDIEKAYISLPDPTALFHEGKAADTLYNAKNAGEIPTTIDTLKWVVRIDAKLAQYPLFIETTRGAKAFLEDNGTLTPFSNGMKVDFSDERFVHLRVVSEDGAWHRNYVLQMIHRKPTSGDMFFDFNANSWHKLTPEEIKERKLNGTFYVWKVVDHNAASGLFIANPEWQNGNPGYALSKSSAAPDAYPTSPCFAGGPDGSDCIKMETMTTGSLGAMAKIYIAAGSLFNGTFDPKSALKSRSAAKQATRFGTEFDHKPIRFSFDARYEPAPDYWDENKVVQTGIVDEPDAYVVVYRNTDASGKTFQLDGNDVVTSPQIVAMARLPHNYTYDEAYNGHPMHRHDLPCGTPIHGVTNEWKHFELNIEYFEDLDPTLLANYGYSMVIGFACSWQGADFRGALGSKFFLDNVRIECEE